MNRKLTALALSGALICAVSLPAMAAGNTDVKPPVAMEEVIPMPASVLYYGTVKELIKDEDGKLIQLAMESEKDGKYVMNLSEDTVWIDSGKHAASTADGLKEGEKLYVFHEAAETRSLPPQTAALAVVRNIPEDGLCAQYHVVEAVEEKDGKLQITTSNGSLIISTDDKTQLSLYNGDAKVTAKDVAVDARIMAWYGPVATSEPAQTYATHLMLLPKAAVPEETEDTEEVEKPEEAEKPADTEVPEAKEPVALDRWELISLLYEKDGKPAVEAEIPYTDVAADAEYADAIRWAAEKKLVNGHVDGTFRPEISLTREQLVVIMWNYAGSPMLADYPGLTTFSDADQISLYAQPAMAWAHQQGLIGAIDGDVLSPKGEVTRELVDTFLAKVEPTK